MNLKESGQLKLIGKELIEDKFIVVKRFWRKQVVEPFAGARYFGERLKITGSDHFTIAKPKDRGEIQHRLLCQFIREFEGRVSPEPGKEPDDSPLVAVWLG